MGGALMWFELGSQVVCFTKSGDNLLIDGKKEKTLVRTKSTNCKLQQALSPYAGEYAHTLPGHATSRFEISCDNHVTGTGFNGSSIEMHLTGVNAKCPSIAGALMWF